jgi:hypothetical protein
MPQKIFHILLPATDHWKQALVMPAVGELDDGILLDRRISSGMLWLELPTGKIWGLTFKTHNSFISTPGIRRLADRLATVQPGQLTELPLQLSKLMGWFACSFYSDDDISEIAEEIVREDIRLSKPHNEEYLLIEASLRRLSLPYIESFFDGIRRFSASLDQNALVLSPQSVATGLPDIESYNYQFHPITKINTYRRQAMQAIPLLAKELSSHTTDHRIRRLQQSIDSGNPLLPVLGDYFRCQKSLARFLVGKDYDLIGNDWRGQLEQLAGLLGGLKPEYWPETEEDWHHFNQWLRPVYNTFATKHRWLQIMENGLNELAKDGYSKIVQRMERHDVALADIATLPDFARDLDFWVKQLGGKNEQTDAAMQQYSIFRLAQLSRRWHQWLTQQAGLDNDEGGPLCVVSIDGWLTFIDEPWEKLILPNECYSVVPLNTTQLLNEEGQRMKHCVAGYSNRCRYSGSHIFSIRKQETCASLSTFELSFGVHDSTASDICMQQHYGPKNTEPSEKCKAVLRDFRRYLQKTPPERLKMIKKELHERNILFKTRVITAKAWPAEMHEGFRELMHDYPALKSIGQV